MTAAQVEAYGRVLGPAGCALVAWRYDAAYMMDPTHTGGSLGGRGTTAPGPGMTPGPGCVWARRDGGYAGKRICFRRLRSNADAGTKRRSRLTWRAVRPAA